MIETDALLEGRVSFLQECLQLFRERAGSIDGRKIIGIHDVLVCTRLVDVYARNIMPIIKRHMDDTTAPDSRYDHHKIIAGTQSAIMASLLLRYEGDEGIPVNSSEARSSACICGLNAAFARCVAIAMLNRWKDQEHLPRLILPVLFIREHKALLMNVGAAGLRECYNPLLIMTNAQLWYAMEEYLKLSPQD